MSMITHRPLCAAALLAALAVAPALAADHSAGNYRVLMNLANDLLTIAADRGLARLDEKLFFDVFSQTPKPKPSARKR